MRGKRVAAGLAVSLMAVSADAAPLDQFRWENRPLVIFAPSDVDARLIEQRALMIADINGLRDRDMVVIAVIGSDRAMSELGPEPKATAAAFRARFGVPDDQFMVVLVGKDGTEKYRAPVTVPGMFLFQIIDQMPMRQREMDERKG